ncbi:hypothetical protein PG994_003113 [Apiospora phragmitis]|uniref:Zn(2)-C6 fungal-type domain-containing protein n=1 Tax=Apiospora phragmitis TaxID=2905665 RepID=A0ABR1W738_9PEZI
MDSQEASPSKKRGRYAYLKCVQCRKDKKKCLPVERQSQEKCDRCEENGFECSSNQIAADSTPSLVPGAPGDTAFRARVKDLLDGWQWYKILNYCFHQLKTEAEKSTVGAYLAKISQELTHLYQHARESRDTTAKVLLCQIYYCIPSLRDRDEAQNEAILAISETILLPGDISNSGLRDLLVLAEIESSAGNTDDALLSLLNTMDDVLENSNVTHTPETMNDICILTEKYVECFTQSALTKRKLYDKNYLNTKQDIPDLLNIYGSPFLPQGAIQDTHIRYLKWLLLEFKPEYNSATGFEG